MTFNFLNGVVSICVDETIHCKGCSEKNPVILHSCEKCCRDKEKLTVWCTAHVVRPFSHSCASPSNEEINEMTFTNCATTSRHLNWSQMQEFSALIETPQNLPIETKLLVIQDCSPGGTLYQMEEKFPIGIRKRSPEIKSKILQSFCWENIGGGRLNQISISNNDIIIGVGNSGSGNVIFCKEEGNWRTSSSHWKHACIGPKGEIWAINNSEEIFFSKSGIDNFQKIDGLLINLSTGTNGQVVGVNRNHHIWYRQGFNEKWIQLNGSLKQVCIGASGLIVGVNSSNEVWMRTGCSQNSPGSNWEKHSINLKHISVGPKGDLVGINNEGEIWAKPNHLVGTPWVKLDGNTDMTYLVHHPNKKEIFAINKEGEIHKRAYDPSLL